MYRESHRQSTLRQRALGMGVVVLSAFAACADPPKKPDLDERGSSGGSDTGGSDTGGSGTGGSGGSAGAAGSGGADSTGGADSFDGGAAGRGSGGGNEGGGAPDECASGLVTCPGSADCTDLDVGNESGDTVSDCGECGVSCSLAHATSSSCSNGACAPECSAGFGDCNADTANDGCETDLSSEAACGARGRTCAKTGVATVACADAKCAPACAPGFLDCNLDDGTGKDDGCEVHGDALATCGATCASSGSPCANEQVCNAGSCGDPVGVVQFSVPFANAGEAQRYGNRFSPVVNLTNSTLVMRVYVPGALGGSLFVYPTDSTDSSAGPGVRVPLETLGTGWVDLEIPIAGPAGPFEPASVYQLTIEVESGTTGPWLGPTVIYGDSIWSENGRVRDTFDANLGQMVASGLMKVEGSTMSWVATPTP